MEECLTKRLRKRNKLEIIMKSLKDNPNVLVVEIQKFNYFPNRNGNWTQKADFIVAPKQGLYTAEELEEFMINLVPELKPTKQDEFYLFGNELKFGKLYFDEKIGEEIVTSTHKMTDSEFTHNFYRSANGNLRNAYELNENNKLTINKLIEHNRRIWVSPYPCEELIKDYLYGNLHMAKYSIELKHLRKYMK